MESSCFFVTVVILSQGHTMTVGGLSLLNTEMLFPVTLPLTTRDCYSHA